MFRCFDCGKSFDDDEILELAENDGFREGPHRTSYVCPHCKGSHYRPFMKDKVSIRQVLEELLDVMCLLNTFDDKLLAVFNREATDNTELYYARCKMVDFITSICEDEDFDLPRNTDGALLGARGIVDARELMDVLTRNIDEN